MHRSRHPRSKVWRYFTRSIDKLNAKCHICSATLSFKGGSISNLHLHLKRKHCEYLDEHNGMLIQCKVQDPLAEIAKIEYFADDENIRKLINLVKQRGNVLYKFSKNNPWNSDIQKQLWNDIAESLGNKVSIEVCRQCWRYLRLFYDLFKKNSEKIQTNKFIDELRFLDVLYDKSTDVNTSIKDQICVSPQNLEQNLSNETVFEDQTTDGLTSSDDGGEFTSDIIEEEYFDPPHEDEHLNCKKSILLHKSFEEMDDLDFFLRFLNKKMRKLSAEDKNTVEMKLTELVFEAETEFD